ncbi:negative cofactor 2 transcription regulator complex subunit ncb2 [Borealophlyctis nickersoniae]|nr:negative cofactor 2 transcription regulator complex subunit ncb2 [Borealophlyctis nickersoniae]
MDDDLDGLTGPPEEELSLPKANDRCEEEQKKTIAGDHVIKALESLGFEEYVKEVMEVYEDHTKTQKDRERRNTKTESTLTDAEKIAMQEQMFAEARARMLGQQLEGGPSTAEAPESDDDDDVKSE